MIRTQHKTADAAAAAPEAAVLGAAIGVTPRTVGRTDGGRRDVETSKRRFVSFLSKWYIRTYPLGWCLIGAVRLSC